MPARGEVLQKLLTQTLRLPFILPTAIEAHGLKKVSTQRHFKHPKASGEESTSAIALAPRALLLSQDSPSHLMD